MKLFSILFLFFTALFSFANEKITPLKGLLVTGVGIMTMPPKKI